MYTDEQTVPSHTESEQLSLTMKLLTVMNTTVENRDMFHDIVDEVKNYLECDAVAIRFLNDHDYPFYASSGLSDSFLANEESIYHRETGSDSCTRFNTMSDHECFCGTVIKSGALNSSNVTEQGSFVTGDINISSQVQSNNFHCKSNCSEAGFKSLLLIPLSHNDTILGTLQCNDRAEDAFSSKEIRFLETLSKSITQAIIKINNTEELHQRSTECTSVRQSGKIGTWVIDVDTDTFISCNGISELHDFDFTVNQTKLSHYLSKRVMTEDMSKVLDMLGKIRKNTGGSVEYRARLSDNSIHYFCSVGSISGSTFQGITVDITEDKRVERSIKENHDFLRSVVNGLNSAILVVDPEQNQIIETNESAQKMFRLSDEELKGIRITTLLSPRFFRNTQSVNMPIYEMETNEEATVVREDGSELPVHKTISKRTINGRTHNLITLTDISQKKKKELQNAHSQKMESIGSLAAGIAHEINSPIQFVGDNMNFLKDSFIAIDQILSKYKQLEADITSSTTVQILDEIHKLEEGSDIDFLREEIPDAIEQSIDGVNRVSTIVRAMKTFSHPAKAEMVPDDCNEIILNTVIIARNEWKYVATIETDLNPNLPEVPIHSDDISQVILNLVVNASHAIEDTVYDDIKGVISINTGFDDNSVFIDISDTGSGIPDEIANQIFDPFFTTKEVGKGTGQGLSMAYSVITDKHKGSISFKSTVGKGTTFSITLPRK